MQLEIPANIQKYLNPTTTAHLVTGTYTMRGADMVEVGKRHVTDNALIFRPANAAPGVRDHQLDIGTLNPSVLAAGNQVVMLMVEMQPSENILDEFRRYRIGKLDGGPVAVCCWVPDGAAGRYMVEQEGYFFRSWFGEGPEMLKQKFVIAGIVVAALVVYLGASFLLSCFLIIAFPFVVALTGFVAMKMRRNAIQRGLLLGHRQAQNMLYRWCADLMESGAFQAEYARAFAATGAPVIGDSGENAFLYPETVAPLAREIGAG